MHLIKLDSKLSNIVIEDPTIVTVLSRFGIKLGVGDNTVGTICQSKGLDSVFFTTILNTFQSPEYFPEKIYSTFKVSIIVDYLQKTNCYYEQYQIPNIERHFSFLLQRTDQANSNLELMMKFFIEVKTELLNRIAQDRNHWFPEVLAMDERKANGVECAIHKFDAPTDNIEDKLGDLINMFVIHLKGDYDQNLCQAVLIALFSLHKDIVQNNRIRYRILKPMAQALAQQQ